ncbi:MAG: epoxyqueuosine reductase QueH [bacterium]|nr:epoxyqueuosine reductase QueH [bacterium]
MKKKLLLHICCAPCAVYVLSLLDKKYDVTGFFYNPNIQPYGEYLFRQKELETLAGLQNREIIYTAHDMLEWFEKVKGLEKEPEKGKRCSICFSMRFEKAFLYAKEHNFDMVASTLSISRYKVTGQINTEGQKLAAIHGVEFLAENFKKQDGYNKGKKMAADLGIVSQDYCGCVFSKVEKKLRERKRAKQLSNE